jgi:hypothetical protein
MDKSPSRI